MSSKKGFPDRTAMFASFSLASTKILLFSLRFHFRFELKRSYWHLIIIFPTLDSDRRDWLIRSRKCPSIKLGNVHTVCCPTYWFHLAPCRLIGFDKHQIDKSKVINPFNTLK